MMAEFDTKPEWVKLKEVVNGETKLDAETVNAVLRAIASRDDFLEQVDGFIKARLNKVLGDLGIQEASDSTQQDPKFKASTLKSLSALPFGEGLNEQLQGLFPANAALVTDANGKPEWVPKSSLGGDGGTPTPTPDIKGLVKEVVFLMERVERPGNSLNTFRSGLVDRWIPVRLNALNRYGEEGIKFLSFNADSTQLIESPPDASGDGWSEFGKAPIAYRLPRGTYFIDGFVNGIYIEAFQARFTLSSGVASDRERELSAVYGNVASTSRLPLRTGDNPNNLEDAIMSISTFSGLIEESIFGDEITKDFSLEVVYHGVEDFFQIPPYPTRPVPAGGIFGIIQGASQMPGQGSGNPVAGFNIYKSLRIQRIE